ncbi:hypothetical protein KEM48_013759 [Puccinia striiformis f. sp. tritici PST-130]|nr:hypothetical protein KEM48_013759 [Puccinia striiformis f. sp. tritici PST-130]
MDSNILAPLNRKILAFSASPLRPIPTCCSRSTSKNHQHSRVARTVRPQSQNMRQTKFSHLGPAGIRAYDSHTAKINGVFIGLIPDAGDTGGNVQTMHEIIQSINGKRPAVFGWYAQVSVHSNSMSRIMPNKVVGQVLDVEITIKLSPCQLPLSIIDQFASITNLTKFDSASSAKVLRRFTDEGVPVIARFAHEVNCLHYQGNDRRASRLAFTNGQLPKGTPELAVHQLVQQQEGIRLQDRRQRRFHQLLTEKLE